MADHAQAFFHRDWNVWTVGFYDSRRAGSAESYTTYQTQEAAERAADAYNAERKRDAAARAAAERKRAR